MKKIEKRRSVVPSLYSKNVVIIGSVDGVGQKNFNFKKSKNASSSMHCSKRLLGMAKGCIEGKKNEKIVGNYFSQ